MGQPESLEKFFQKNLEKNLEREEKSPYLCPRKRRGTREREDEERGVSIVSERVL